MDPKAALEKGHKVEATVSPATDIGIQEFMQGSAHNFGGRHDLEGRGIGSGMEGTQLNAPREVQPEPALPREQETIYVQDQVDAQRQDQDFQKMYGESENEKGEWRRMAKEQAEQLALMQAELNAMRQMGWNGQQGGYTQPQAQSAPPRPPGQYGYASPPTYAPVDPNAIPQTFFPEKNPDDIVEVRDVDEMVRQAIAPAVVQLHNAQVQMQQQYLAQLKEAAGITQEAEQKALAKAPWLQNLPEGQQRIQAIKQVLSIGRAPEPQAQTPQRPTDPAAPAMRRVTYVESANQRAGSDRAPDPKQVMAEEWAKCRTASQMKAFLNKYGMEHVNDYGPGVYTRDSKGRVTGF